MKRSSLNRRSKSPKAKRKAWAECSIYNRQKDADSEGMVACVTCGDVKHWKQGDAGHFIAGRLNANLFDDRGIHFQCKPCNGNFKQKAHLNIPEEYENYMLNRYGQEVIDELRAQNKTTRQYTIEDYERIYEKYRKKNTQRSPHQ